MKTKLAIPLLIVAYLGLHVPVLMLSQSHTDGEESCIGIMAQNITLGRAFPVYFVGQDYNGGGAIEAYVAAGIFSIFGWSSIGLKTASFLFSIVTLVILFALTRRYMGLWPAIIAALLFMTSSALAEWCFKARGGYTEQMLFFTLIIGLCMRIISLGPSIPRLLLLGAVSGVGVYNLELILPLLVTIGLWAILLRKTYRIQYLAWVCAGFAIGYLPSIVYNLTHRFANIRSILSQRHTGHTMPLIERPLFFITHMIPSLFVARNADMPIAIVPISAWVEAVLFAAMIAATALWSSRYILKTKIKDEAGICAKMGVFLCSYIAMHAAFIFFSNNGVGSPRYLVVLMPALILCCAIATYAAFHEKPPTWRIPSIVACGTLIILGIATNVSLLQTRYVNDDILVAHTGQTKDTLINVTADPLDLVAVQDFLLSKNITLVRSSLFPTERMIFESNQRIIASAYKMTPGGGVRNMHYDSIVYFAPHPALVLDKRDIQFAKLRQSPQFAGMGDTVIGVYHVLFPRNSIAQTAVSPAKIKPTGVAE